MRSAVRRGFGRGDSVTLRDNAKALNINVEHGHPDSLKFREFG
jgi:hypothetical protein